MAWQEDDTWLGPLPSWQEEGIKGYLPITQKDFPPALRGALCTFLYFGSKIWRRVSLMVIVEKHNGPIFPKAKNLKEIEDNFPGVHHWTVD